MRIPKYLSPTSISLFHTDRTEFYLRYLADERPPRFPQTLPMAAGSAFDAFVKNYLVYALHGTVAPEFEIEAIFEAQVEEQNRDWAFENGEHLFNQYKACGALADLMLELQQASSEPRFEFTVQQNVPHEGVIGGIPLLGKPDIFFETVSGLKVILDWKVNGYCATRPKSPAKGYMKVRDGFDLKEYKSSRNNGQAHKDCQPMMIGDGIQINVAHFLEDVDKSWADQTTIYLWILGEPVGTKAVVGIDQLCGIPREDAKASIRVATHRCRVSEAYQVQLMERIGVVWEACISGNVFEHDNEETCAKLDNYHKAFEGDTPQDEWFRKISGR